VGACPTLGCRAAPVRALPIASAKEGTRSLTGRWAGTYFYSSGNRIEFRASLEEREGNVLGRTTEPNVRIFRMSPEFFADLKGQVVGDSVRFVKTYDGTGGARHSVVYEGRLSPDGTTIEGRWSIGGCLFLTLASGPFSMRRV
jgi:hypothetical protein